MRLKTDFVIPPPHFKISHGEKIFSVGSCFASEMTERFSQAKFQVVANPFGTLYNAISMENALLRIYSQQFYTEEELFEYEGIYHSWDHHSEYSGISTSEVLKKINDRIQEAHTFLQKADVIILTLGSSYYYELKSMELPVANCHKVPNANFEKKLLSVEETKAALQNIVTMVRDLSTVRPHFILSLSPVLHLKDSLLGNRRSKSIALEALHQLTEENQEVYYFPSFEIMQDELRDYRFYNESMTHPNAQAKKYIWERFSETVCTEDTLLLIHEIAALESMKNHRSLIPGSQADQKTQQLLELKLKQFRAQYPEIDI